MSSGRLFLDRVARQQSPSPLHRQIEHNMRLIDAWGKDDISTLPGRRHFYFALTSDRKILTSRSRFDNLLNGRSTYRAVGGGGMETKALSAPSATSAGFDAALHSPHARFRPKWSKELNASNSSIHEVCSCLPDSLI
jgi:hypothetical protein